MPPCQYRWTARRTRNSAACSPHARLALAAFMDAVVIVEPLEYQRRHAVRIASSHRLQALAASPAQRTRRQAGQALYLGGELLLERHAEPRPSGGGDACPAAGEAGLASQTPDGRARRSSSPACSPGPPWTTSPPGPRRALVHLHGSPTSAPTTSCPCSCSPRASPRRRQARERDKALGYFEANAERMRYARFRQLGMFVGSGTVEAGCKAIGQRLKQSGCAGRPAPPASSPCAARRPATAARKSGRGPQPDERGLTGHLKRQHTQTTAG